MYKVTNQPYFGRFYACGMATTYKDRAIRYAADWNREKIPINSILPRDNRTNAEGQWIVYWEEDPNEWGEVSL